MNDILYAIDGLDLVSGNKSAGFVVTIPKETVRCLAQLSVTREETQACNQAIQDRLQRAKLLPKAITRCSGVVFNEGTLLPRVFMQDPMVGGSLGFEHRELEDILSTSLQPEYCPPSLAYTPHNVDAAKQALVLMVVVQTWAEWARAKVALAAVLQNELQKELKTDRSFKVSA